MSGYNFGNLKMNKVLVNLHQEPASGEVNRFTAEEQQRARDNIGASDGKTNWVTYNSGSSVPTVERSSLSVVSSEQGARVQNFEGDKKYFLAPEPASGDDGRVLGVRHGSVTWIDPPPQKEDSFIKMKRFKSFANSNNKYVIGNSWELPTMEGIYPSKVHGFVDAMISGDSGSGGYGYCMSIIPTNTYHSALESPDTPFDPAIDLRDSHNANFLSPDPVAAHVEFMFETSGSEGMKYLTLKGRSEQNYNIGNLAVECIYEQMPNED